MHGVLIVIIIFLLMYACGSQKKDKKNSYKNEIKIEQQDRKIV